jgi:hypothetical protein
MHIDISVTRSRGKVYKRVLLRTSYREGKKVKQSQTFLMNLKKRLKLFVLL